jgi:ABC-type thiamine transport system ATPase subunit
MPWISVYFVPWLLNEKRMQWYVLMCLGMKPEMIKTLLSRLQQEKKKTGFIVTRNQTDVLSLENTTLSIAKESKASQVKHQKHVGDLGHYWEFCNI